MLQKQELKTLSNAVSNAWKFVNFAKVNGLDVRLRIVTGRAATQPTPNHRPAIRSWRDHGRPGPRLLLRRGHYLAGPTALAPGAPLGLAPHQGGAFPWRRSLSC